LTSGITKDALNFRFRYKVTQNLHKNAPKIAKIGLIDELYFPLIFRLNLSVFMQNREQ